MSVNDETNHLETKDTRFLEKLLDGGRGGVGAVR